MRGLGDVADDIRWRGGVFHVHKEKRPSIGLQTPSQLSGKAGLAHAPLARQQDMCAATHLRLEQPQLGISIEKVRAQHRRASLWLHLEEGHSRLH